MIEQFKRLKTIVLKSKPRVRFEDRKNMHPTERKNEVVVGEALSKLGLIYDSVEEVKRENLRLEGLSE